MRGAGQRSSTAVSSAIAARAPRACRLALLGSTAILLGSLLSTPLLANDECGTGTSVVCDGTDANYPTFPNGITYNPVTDLTLVVEGGAAIAPASGIEGIDINSSAGIVDVTLEDGSSITTTGNFAEGILIQNAYDVTVSAAGDISTSGSDSHGVYIKGALGDVSLSLSGTILTTFTDSSGIIVRNSDGNVTLALSQNASIESTGNNSEGVYVRSNTGDVVFAMSSGSSINTTGQNAKAVYIRDSHGYVSVFLSDDSSIETQGASASHGIRVRETDGNVTIQSLGTIETNGSASYGIVVNNNYGSVDVTASGAITTSGGFSHGISLDFNYGSVSVDSSSDITTHGDDASGIKVYAAYETDISISHAGSITTSGATSHGIYVYSAYWSSNPPGAPLSIDTSAGSTITVSGNGADGINIISYSDTITDITLDLAGSIKVQGTGAAIRVIGDNDVSIDNTGLIEGAVILGDGDDSFVNAGTLYTDAVDMGGGNDTLVNSGTIALSSASGAIVDLESFTHSGIIDLANGTPGDTLSISGEFVSAGGALYLDASLDSGTADLLTLASVAASSNPTLIHVTDVGGIGSALYPILIVDAQSDASNGSAFISAPFGAYQYQLAYDDAGFDWYLDGLGIYPGTAEYPALVSGALLSFQSDLPALHNRLHDYRWADAQERIEPAAWTGPSPVLRPWLHVAGSQQEIDTGAPFDLDATRLEAGLDASLARDGRLYSFGAFAGTGTTRQDFEASSSEAEADVLLAGLYAGYRQGDFYGNAIVKYERQWADLRSLATGNDSAPYSIDLLGLSVEGGYRYTIDQAYLQPRLRLSYAHAWAGSLEDASGATIDLDDAASLAGEIAARLGLALLPASGPVDLYLDLALIHEFIGKTQAEVSGLVFTDELPGTSARLASGLAMNLLGDKLTLSLEATYAAGEEARAVSATAALRLRY